MIERKRVQLQPAWLLHHRPFRDSSQILDVLSRDHGRVSVVARGSRAAKSRLKGVLRPFLPLTLSWYSRGDLGTLTGAELGGPPLALTGDPLLAAYYMNELIINLVHRHDPQPEIFALYADALRRLAGAARVAAELREFELDMLSLLGYGVALEQDDATGAVLAADAYYEYRPGVGPVRSHQRDAATLYLGSELTAVGRREFHDEGTLRCANRLLRQVIAYHLDGKELNSRKVLRDIHRSVRPRATTND